jgi:N-ethylmaleimide reductase
VELQGSNSHLIEEFLEDQRTDEYGGSKANRARFLLEIVDEVTAAIGVDRLGARLSPLGQYRGIHDSNPLERSTLSSGNSASAESPICT